MHLIRDGLIFLGAFLYDVKNKLKNVKLTTGVNIEVNDF